MPDILERIDAATDNLCMCGCGTPLNPAGPSAYYVDAAHQQAWMRAQTTRPHEVRGSEGVDPDQMRWRPDLVTDADDANLLSLGSQSWYDGRYHAQVFERTDRPETWHLRLDDGHRYVGADLAEVGGRQDPLTAELEGRVREAWRRLERELGDARRLVPADDDPWVDAMGSAVQWARNSVMLGGVGAPFSVDDLHRMRRRRLDLLSYYGPATLHIDEHVFQVTAELRETEDLNTYQVGWSGDLTITAWPAAGTLVFTPLTRSRLTLPDGRACDVALGEWTTMGAEPTTIEVAGLGPAPFRPEPDADGWPPNTGWQRRCRCCSRHGAPVAGQRVVSDFSSSLYPGLATNYDTELCDICPYCREPFPGPLLSARWYLDPSATTWRLVLQTEHYKVGRVISVEELRASTDPAVLIQNAWDRLEADLLRQVGQPPVAINNLRQALLGVPIVAGLSMPPGVAGIHVT